MWSASLPSLRNANTDVTMSRVFAASQRAGFGGSKALQLVAAILVGREKKKKSKTGLKSLADSKILLR